MEEFLIGFPPITRDQAIKVLELARTDLFDFLSRSETASQFENESRRAIRVGVSAESQVRQDGDRVISVVLTDAGANKMRDLTTAQLNKLVALVVDGKVIWAPRTGRFAKQSVLTGSGPGGLTQEEVQLIMASLRQALRNGQNPLSETGPAWPAPGP